MLSSLALILLFWQWRALPGTIWQVDAGWGQSLLYALFAFGWLLVLTGTSVINHFNLFGLRQVWQYARGKPSTPLPFKQHFSIASCAIRRCSAFSSPSGPPRT
ncbi:MAG: hypothetical protein ABIQ36_01320 [Rhodanobacter sp.]